MNNRYRTAAAVRLTLAAFAPASAQAKRVALAVGINDFADYDKLQ